MLVLGVDPGSNVTGYGLVEKKNNKLSCVGYGIVRPPAKSPFSHRIYHIFKELSEIMGRFEPEQMAVEDLFYAKNAKSSLKLGHARGAIFVAAVQNKVRIFEYTPLEIKKSVVGYGRATKEQVRTMVKMILKLDTEPALDTTDALAAAICHLHWHRFENALNNQSGRKNRT
ncbi:MAG: crossover junction endodeoxyribonuclease RuvC [Deltaproteobacteria bacterium]|nr:crossover junction endodeoxyribonuclease RuvC [Deltaproteobacteria bacterium]